jgi:hypothetical protein
VLTHIEESRSYSGWLEKEGKHFKTWKRRFFTVKNKNLIYYKDDKKSEAQGHGTITSVLVYTGKPFSLEIVLNNDRIMRVSGGHQEEMDRWYHAISTGLGIFNEKPSEVLSDNRCSCSSESDMDFRSAPCGDHHDNDYFSNEIDSYKSIGDYYASFTGTDVSFKGELVYDKQGNSVNGQNSDPEDDMMQTTREEQIAYRRALIESDEAAEEQMKVKRKLEQDAINTRKLQLFSALTATPTIPFREVSNACPSIIYDTKKIEKNDQELMTNYPPKACAPCCIVM